MVFTLYYRLGPSAMPPAANGRLGGTIKKSFFAWLLIYNRTAVLTPKVLRVYPHTGLGSKLVITFPKQSEF